MIQLIVGLGNPGPQYEDTRHNAGFWWTDAAARKLGLFLNMERSYHGLMGRTTIQGKPVWVLQPQTFMNRSGQSVGALARFFKIPPENILVVHDELDLEPGQVKLKKDGGHAGHNGLRDIHAQLGSPDYWRLRIGIGHPGDRNQVVGFVLKPARREEQPLIDEAIDRALATWPLLARGDFHAATTRINARPTPPKATPDA